MYSIHDIMEMMVPWFDGGTYIIDRRSHEEKGALQQNYVDTLCLSYLGNLIDNLNLVPFQSEGDGNCLLHAVCKAVSGKDTQFGQLREQMTQELIENEPWYRFHLRLDDSEWNKSLEMARGDGNYLGFEHIFALSNVLRRPILLLDNLIQVSAFGEGDGGVAATFLPTRHPIGPVIAPPLMIAWSSEDHRHYVPIVPALMYQDRYPRILMPKVAFAHTLPPGVQPEDYFHYRVAARYAECKLELKMQDRLLPAVSRLISGDDPFQNALIITRKFGMSRERIIPLTNFLLDLAVAHAVPTLLSDASWKSMIELNGIPGRFPNMKPRSGPKSDISKLNSIVQKTIAELQPPLGEKQANLIQQLLEFPLEQFTASYLASQAGKPQQNGSSTSVASSSSSNSNNNNNNNNNDVSNNHTDNHQFVLPDEEAFDVLVEIITSNPKPAVFIGLLHCFLSLPAPLIASTVAKWHIPSRLVSIVKQDTPQPVLVSLLRCFTCLLNPEIGYVSNPLIFHQQLMSTSLKLIDDLPVLHWSTLAPFLHNYALFISHSQLFSPRARDEHVTALAAFLIRIGQETMTATDTSSSKATLNSTPPPSISALSVAAEMVLIGIGNIILVEPLLVPRALDTILPLFHDVLKPLNLPSSLIDDLTLLCTRTVPKSSLSRAPSILTE